MMRRIEPEFIRRTVEALLLQFPDLADDEELRVCALEGETPVFELLAAVVDDIRGAGTMQQAIESRIGELRARKERFVRRETACRKLAQRIMDAADLRKAVLPEATLSVRPAPRAVRIIHPDFIPAEFWRVKREPDLTAIKTALKAGADVPGAALSNAADTLAILSR